MSSHRRRQFQKKDKNADDEQSIYLADVFGQSRLGYDDSMTGTLVATATAANASTSVSPIAEAVLDSSRPSMQKVKSVKKAKSKRNLAETMEKAKSKKNLDASGITMEKTKSKRNIGEKAKSKKGLGEKSASKKGLGDKSGSKKNVKAKSKKNVLEQDDLVIAEGVPLTGNDSLVSMHESNREHHDADDDGRPKMKKSKSKKSMKSLGEKSKSKKNVKGKSKKNVTADDDADAMPNETFHDEESQDHNNDDDDRSIGSNSVGEEEPLSAEEKAELEEKKVRNGLLAMFIGALALMGCMKLVNYLISLCMNSNSVDTSAADDANAVAQAATMPPPPGPTGLESTVVANQMAVAASQSAAASAASGGSASAAAAATATAAATTVTSTSAVTTVAVGGLGYMAVKTGLLPNPFASVPPPTDYTCPAINPPSVMALPGRLTLHMRNVPATWFEDPTVIEGTFAKVYNDLFATCVDKDDKEAQQLLLLEYQHEKGLIGANLSQYNMTNVSDWMTVADNVDNATLAEADAYYANLKAKIAAYAGRHVANVTLDDWRLYTADDGRDFITTDWTAQAVCHKGAVCSMTDPLFQDNQDKITDPAVLLFEYFMGNLTQDLQEITLTDAETARRFLQDTNTTPEVYYGATYDATMPGNVLLKAYGKEVPIPASYTEGGVGGAIDKPKGEADECGFGDNAGLLTETKTGHVTIGLATQEGGMTADFFQSADPATLQELEAAFRESYQDVIGKCGGDYKRHMEFSTLDESVGALGSDGLLYIQTKWTANLKCDGCDDVEPLFAEPSANVFSSAAESKKQNTTLSTAEDKSRSLQAKQSPLDLDLLLGKFAESFGAKCQAIYSNVSGTKTQSVVYYANTRGSDDKGDVVQETGLTIDFIQLDSGDWAIASHGHGTLNACGSDTPPKLEDLHDGSFTVELQGLSKAMVESNMDLVLTTAMDAYNNATGGCDGPQGRQMHSISLADAVDVASPDEILEVPVSRATFNAKVESSKAPVDAQEPLFAGVTMASGARRLQTVPETPFGQYVGVLKEDLNKLVQDQTAEFVAREAAGQNVTFPFGKDPSEVTIPFGEVYDVDGTVLQKSGTPIEDRITKPLPTPAPGAAPIVNASQCSSVLEAANTEKNSQLTEAEYVGFVKELFILIRDPATWQKDMNFDKLPDNVQANFDSLSAGGEIFLGKRKGPNESDLNAQAAEDRKARQESICFYTSQAVDAGFPAPTEAPTTEAPTYAAATAAPTQLPTTGAPTTTPTLAPTGAPSESPSAAPTETRLVNLQIQWKYTLGYALDADPTGATIRMASDDELNKLTNGTQDFINKNIGLEFANDTNTTFESHELHRVSADFNPSVTEEMDYNIRVITSSDFVFRGAQPTPKGLFERMKSFNLTQYASDYLWVLNPQPGEVPWIFDDTSEIYWSTV